MDKPILLELFAGTRSISRAFEKAGWITYSVEWDKKFTEISLYADISKLTKNDIIKLCKGTPAVIWASPDCCTYSVAGIRYHRARNPLNNRWTAPNDEYARFCDKTNEHLIKLIEDINPRLWFIENPRGNLQYMDFMRPLEMFKKNVCYCQYGDKRKKPTQIWTNADIVFNNCPGASCNHWRSKGGASDLVHGAKLRGIIPPAFCEYIVKTCNRLINGGAIPFDNCYLGIA